MIDKAIRDKMEEKMQIREQIRGASPYWESLLLGWIEADQVVYDIIMGVEVTENWRHFHNVYARHLEQSNAHLQAELNYKRLLAAHREQGTISTVINQVDSLLQKYV